VAEIPSTHVEPVTSFEELCRDPEAADWVLKQLAAAGKADRLKGFERIAAVSGAHSRRPRTPRGTL
jgi:hypothetical protein